MAGEMMKTRIYFKYGGGYMKDDKDGNRWISKERRVYAITLNTTSMEEITYTLLEDAIAKKIEIDRGSTRLKLSYIPFFLEDKWPAYIFDDDDVDSYLGNKNEGGHLGILHVEPVIREVGSSFAKNYEAMESVIREGEDDGKQKMDVEEDDDDEDWDGVDEDDMGDEDDSGDYDDSEDDSEDEDVGKDDNQPGNEIIEIGEDPEPPLPFDGNEQPFYGNEQPFYGNEQPFDGNEQPFDGNERPPVREWDDESKMELYDEFSTKHEVQDILMRAAHDRCFDFKICNSDSWRYVLKCRAIGCDWFVRVVRVRRVGKWKVVKYRSKHTCSPIETSTTTNKRKGTVKMVANVLNEFYPGCLDTPSAKSIIGLVQNKIGVEVSYATALRGKKAAANYVRGDAVENYKIFPSYLYMVEKLNPGSVTRYKLDAKGRFKYLFIALGACIEGFLAMRKVLSVDATHLKTVRRGVLVFATAQDPDRHHYPIAFAILDGEKNASWDWFFTQMRSIVGDDPELVWISDRNASLIRAIAQLYPRAQHGYCMYHLSQNIRLKVSTLKKGPCAERFRELATMYTEAEFVRSYVEFAKAYPEAVKYLEEKVVEGPKKWARCYFPGERYNINTTNSSESLNNVFRKARKYSLLLLLDTVIEKIAEWFNKYRKASVGRTNAGKLVPKLEKELSNRCHFAKKLKVVELNSFMTEYTVIGKDGKGYLVSLNNRTCSCRCFDIDKYPCVHGIAALFAYRKIEGRPRDIHIHELCSTYYLMDTWALAYYRTIYLVPHESQWHGIPEHIKLLKPDPPKYRPKKGRLQETRIPSAGEKRSRADVSGGTTADVSDDSSGDDDQSTQETTV